MSTAVPDALFFDVDGVLIDSMSIKEEIFVQVFSDFPDSDSLVRSFHRVNGGLNREAKIRRLLELLTLNAPTDSEVRERVNIFSSSIEGEIQRASLMPGICGVLNSWSERIALYAVSATPTDELRSLFASMELLNFFKGVRGWPPGKAELLTETIRANDFNSSRCILIGDSQEDREAALLAGVHFMHYGLCEVDACGNAHNHFFHWGSFDDAMPQL